jgi:FkbM family methyltransferase
MTIEGWHLPSGDSYFTKFVPGGPGKKNGFQRDHLLWAFKYVRDWRVAVDVGAHVGFWTIDMADRFAKVLAFEPSADTYDCLVKNMAGLTNVTTAQFALGAKNGRARIAEDDKRKGNTGSRYVLPDDSGTVETIPMVALDELNLEACDLLKVDVEGFELQVLQGANRTIWKYKPVVIMETDKNFSRARYGIHPGAAEKFLLAHHYREMAHLRPDKIFVPDVQPV